MSVDRLAAWCEELANAPDEATRQWIGKTGGKALGQKPRYTTWLERFHEEVKPGVYLEIGVDTGTTLKLAKPGTLAIGVDPAPKVYGPFPTDTIIYGVDSNKYFVMSPPATHDLAFIDGLHLYEQVLRDFINCEWYGHEGSIIVVHDIWPSCQEVAYRDQMPGAWTGDVWKLIPILMKYRPDLKIEIIDTPPSGLALITNLDPNNLDLHHAYDDIIAEWFPKEYDLSHIPALKVEKPYWL